MRDTKEYKKKLHRRILPLVLCACLLTGSVLQVQATESEGEASSQTESQETESSSEETEAQETTRSELDDIRESLEDVENQLGQLGGELGALEGELGQAQNTQNSLQQNKTEMEKYLDKLNSQSKTLASKVASVEKQIKTKLQEIADKEASIAAKKEAIASKETEIALIEANIEMTKQHIAETEKDLAKQYEAMKLRIQFMYENSSAGQYLEMLLKSESFIDFLNQVEYIVAMLEYDEKMQDKIQGTKQGLEETKAGLEAEDARLILEREALDAERESLEEEHASLQDDKRELEKLKVDLNRQQKAVAAQQTTSVQQLQEYIDEMAANSDKINSYEETIALKLKYYEDLIAQKKHLEDEENRRMAEEEANNTGGNIGEGDAEIDNSMEIDISEEEYVLLASIIMCEAGGESYEGKLGVGYVIMNRVRSHKYANNITGVVYQPGQFSPVASGRLATVLAREMDPALRGKAYGMEACYRAAREVLTGISNVGESLYFRTHKPVPQLEENLKAAGIPYYIIGAHIFYHTWVKYR
ncbi:MAG: cell wall hydrolase [Lachnospiraceae bacterium]|nr:cell wall hydrolase [Lachnospiraceae bacterium]